MGNIAEQIRALGKHWWNLKGNGGMQASALDMHAWYKVLNGDGALSQNVRAQLTTPHSPWADGVAEGYGWYCRSDDDGRMRQMSHSGSDGVFFSYYRHRLDRRAFMCFVGNSGEEPAKDVLRKVLGILTSSFD
jgi:CubicO group peptidase (beta-lactamase class C family)